MKKFFTSKKKETPSFFPKNKPESVKQMNHELGSTIELCSACYAHILLSDTSNNRTTINLLRASQDNLGHESNYDEDFKLENKGDYIALRGNIRTGLICLRHAGLLAPDALPGLVDKLESMIKNENLEKSLTDQYEENYKIALKKYPLEVCAPYPLDLGAVIIQPDVQSGCKKTFT